MPLDDTKEQRMYDKSLDACAPTHTHLHTFEIRPSSRMLSNSSVPCNLLLHRLAPALAFGFAPIPPLRLLLAQAHHVPHPATLRSLPVAHARDGFHLPLHSFHFSLSESSSAALMCPPIAAPCQIPERWQRRSWCKGDEMCRVSLALGVASRRAWRSAATSDHLPARAARKHASARRHVRKIYLQDILEGHMRKFY